MDPLDKRLLKDLDRLAKRVNSEAGVPMFLACENLGADAGQLRSGAAGELNRDFVSAFHRDVEFLQIARPDAPLSDLAKIVERLAEQEFAIDGAHGSS